MLPIFSKMFPEPDCPLELEGYGYLAGLGLGPFKAAFSFPSALSDLAILRTQWGESANGGGSGAERRRVAGAS